MPQLLHGEFIQLLTFSILLITNKYSYNLSDPYSKQKKVRELC